MKAIVKISWSKETPRLRLASEDGFEDIKLSQGREIEYEVTDKRRCVGFHREKGVMEPCPEFREVKSGDQCPECRRRDIYTGWRKGESSPETEVREDYSVYLAQCGNEVKVGVTRSSRLETRWLEQGANYAAEIFSGLKSQEALEKEENISDRGIRQRIRKEEKLGGQSPSPLEEKMKELGFDNKKVQNISDGLKAREIVRKGVMPSPITAVKGQIISDGRVAMALSSGKVLERPRQKDLGSF